MRFIERFDRTLRKDFFIKHPKLDGVLYEKLFKPVLKIDLKRTWKRTGYDTRKDPYYAALYERLREGNEDNEKVKKIMEYERDFRIRYGIEA